MDEKKPRVKSGKKREKKKKKTLMGEILSWVYCLAAAVAAALLIRTFLFQIIHVKGDSMLETLQNRDIVYVSVLSSRFNGYEHGDIVICVYPGADHQCVKRVIGLPGDSIRIERGVVYRNGEAIDEPYLTHFASYSTEEITLGEGEYYVLGDNRPVSHDSHSPDVGVVTEMVGEVRCVIWPLGRIGTPLQ